VDNGPVGRNGEAALCLVCGAAIDLAGIGDLVGKSLVGGEANPAALARPSTSKTRRTGRTAAPSARTGARKTAGGRSTGRKPAAGAANAATTADPADTWRDVADAEK
jgi:hypothetical protein